MSEQIRLIKDTAERLFGDSVDKALLDLAESGEFPVGLWQAVVENGFHELGAAESGTGYAELYAFLQVAGAHAVPLPLAESLLANCWLGGGETLTSIGRLEGDQVVDVPWGRAVARVLGIDMTAGRAVVLDAPTLVSSSANMAGEPRDVVTGAATDVSIDDASFELLALTRGALASGALRTALAISITYATEREQFGRTISKFQAIQHTLAVMAAEVSAAGRATDAAIDALGSARQRAEVAAAKARVGEAVGIVAEAAHQVHGAIGYTHEHRLHHYTRRLWAWRDEYGSEVDWQEVLGAVVVGEGADGVWQYLATAG